MGDDLSVLLDIISQLSPELLEGIGQMAPDDAAMVRKLLAQQGSVGARVALRMFQVLNPEDAA